MKTLLVVILLGLSTAVLAGEWFGYPVLGYQIEIPSTSNGLLLCENSSDLVASPYIRQPIYNHKGIAVVGNLNHKSCQFGKDEPSYDAIGVGIELKTCWLVGKKC